MAWLGQVSISTVLGVTWAPVVSCRETALEWWQGPKFQDAPGSPPPLPASAALSLGTGAVAAVFLWSSGAPRDRPGRRRQAGAAAAEACGESELYAVQSACGSKCRPYAPAMLHSHGKALGEEDVGAASAAGLKGGSQSVNQDALALRCRGSSLQVGAVLDGHGPLGHRVAAQLRDSLPALLEGAAAAEDVPAAVREAFAEAEDELMRAAKREGFSVQFSGAAAVAVILRPDDGVAYMAGCGDCQALLLHTSADGFVVNKVHKAHSATERRRIEAAGGIVQVNPHGGFGAASRVYTPSRACGLAMSRSFGDAELKKCGVICTPDVMKVSLQWPGSCCVLGSDGLFEFLDMREVADMLREQLPKLGAQVCANSLVAAAQEAWKQAEGGHYCDDITCLILSSRDIGRAAAESVGAVAPFVIN